MSGEIQKPLNIVRDAFSIEYGGHQKTVVLDDDDPTPIHLNEIYEFFGSPPNKEPKQWSRLPDGIGAIAARCRDLKVGKSHLWKVKRGKHLGGTWTDSVVAHAYVMYLSPDAKVAIIKGYQEYVRELRDPGLKAKRAYDAYLAQGRTPTWINWRFRNIGSQKILTSTMSDHNCKRIGDDNPYAEANTSISLAVTGKTPRENRAEKGLTRHDAQWDYQEEEEQAARDYVQVLAIRKIKDTSADGNRECVACVRVATSAMKRMRSEVLGQGCNAQS